MDRLSQLFYSTRRSLHIFNLNYQALTNGNVEKFTTGTGSEKPGKKNSLATCFCYNSNRVRDPLWDMFSYVHHFLCKLFFFVLFLCAKKTNTYKQTTTHILFETNPILSHMQRIHYLTLEIFNASMQIGIILTLEIYTMFWNFAKPPSCMKIRLKNITKFIF